MIANWYVSVNGPPVTTKERGENASTSSKRYSSIPAAKLVTTLVWYGTPSKSDCGGRSFGIARIVCGWVFSTGKKIYDLDKTF